MPAASGRQRAKERQMINDEIRMTNEADSIGFRMVIGA
jgi:hypothetical protein